MNHYSNKIQIISESISLLNIVARQAPYITSYMGNKALKYGISIGGRAHDIISELQSIENEARDEFKDDMNDIHFFFDSSEETHSRSFANLLLIINNLHISKECDSFDEYENYLENIKEDDYLKAFYDYMVSFYASSMDDSEDFKPALADIVNAILDMELPDSEKVRLQQLFFNRKKYYPRIFALLKMSADIINKHKKELIKFGDTTIDYLKRELGDLSFSKYVVGNLYSERLLDKYPEECDVSLCYFDPALLGLSLDVQKKNNKIQTSLGVVGIIYHDSLNMELPFKSMKQLDSDKALSILKLLADKSKFEILASTKDNPAYGAQLAEKLSLTTATISHHTSALLEHNLLTIDKVDTKIFYRENKEQINAVIQYLRDNLLN